MNKQTKMWLGIALVGVAGYMLWKQSKKSAAFSGGVMGDRSKFSNFATAATVVDGRMMTPGKQKFTVAQ